MFIKILACRVRCLSLPLSFIRTEEGDTVVRQILDAAWAFRQIGHCQILHGGRCARQILDPYKAPLSLPLFSIYVAHIQSIYTS